MAISGGDGSIVLTTKVDESGLSSGLSKLKSGVGSFVKAFAAAGVAGVTAFAGITTAAVKSYAEFEQLSGGVQKIFDEIDYSKIAEDAGNAYKTMGMSANEYLGVMTTVGANFASTLGDAKGYEVAKQGMQAISDFASGTGRSVDELSEKYQMITKSTSSYQSIADQFAGILPATSAGFLEQAQAAGFLSESYTKLTDVPMAEYQEAVTQMLSKGVDALGLTGNTAMEASTTLSGATAMMKASWQNLLTGMADPTQDFNALLQNFISSVGTFAGNLLPVIQTAAQGVLQMIQGLLPQLGSMVSQMLPMVVEGVSGIITGIVQMLPQIVQAITGILPQLLNAVTGIIVEIANQLPQIIQILVSALPTIIQTIVSVLPTLIPALITGIVQAIDTLISALPSILQPIIDALPDVIISIVQAIVDNLPMIISGIISLVLAIVEAIPQIIQAIVDALPTVISLIIQALLNNLPAIIKGLIQVVIGIVRSLPQILGSLIEGIVNTLAGIWDGLSNVFGNLGDWFGEKFSGAWEAIQNAWSGVVEWFSGIWDSICEVFANVGTWFSDVFTSAWEGIKNIWSSVTGFFSNIWSGITGVFASVGSWFSSKFSDAVSAIKNVWSNIKSFFTSKWDEITGVFKDAKDKFLSIGKNIVDGIKNGISNAWKNLKQWFEGLFGDLIGIAKKILGIKSPSRVFRDEIGKQIPAGMAIGIDEAKNLVTKATKALVTDTRSEVQKVLDKMNEDILESEKLYATESERLKKSKTDADKKYLEKLKEAAEYERKIHDARQKDVENAQKNIVNAYENAVDEILDSIEDLQKRQEKLADKLSDFGSIMEDVTEIEDKFGDVHSAITEKDGRYVLENLNVQTRDLEKYYEQMMNLKNRAGMSVELFDVIKNMSFEESLAYANKLMKMGDKQFSNYIESWEKKQETSKRITEDLFGDDGTLGAKRVLSDVIDQTNVLSDYYSLLEQVKNRAELPEGFFDTLRDMGVEEGLEYANALLELSDEDFANYIKAWEEKQKTSQLISKELYKDEAEQLATEIGDKFEEVEKEFFGVGENAADQFESGFIEQLKTVVSNIKGTISSAFSNVGLGITPNYYGIGGYSINVPALARGSVLPGGKPFLAIVNDQPRGQTNVEAPLQTIVDAMNIALNNNGGREVIREEHYNLGETELMTILYKLVKGGERLKGKSLI